MAASCSSKTYNPYSVAGGDDSNITIHEDETCFLVSIAMPDIHEKDLQITLERNVLTISGFRRNNSGSSHDSCYDTNTDDECDNGEQRRIAPGYNNTNTSTKRQRLSRQLEIDPNAIDIERAMASTWNGCYNLYAPKRRQSQQQFTGLVL